MSNFMNTALKSTSYMLTKTGDMIPVRLHVPSTSYINRKIFHLSPVDAEFLLDRELISEAEAGCILRFCFHEYLNDAESIISPSIMDIIQFRDYAEIKFLPYVSQIFDTSMNQMKSPLTDDEKAQFTSLQKHWYDFLKTHYVKVYVLNGFVDFRITGEDSEGWLDVIREICRTKFGGAYRYNVAQETGEGYTVLYSNAALNTVLNEEPGAFFAEGRGIMANDAVIYH